MAVPAIVRTIIMNTLRNSYLLHPPGRKQPDISTEVVHWLKSEYSDVLRQALVQVLCWIIVKAFSRFPDGFFILVPALLKGLLGLGKKRSHLISPHQNQILHLLRLFHLKHLFIFLTIDCPFLAFIYNSARKAFSFS